MKQSKCVALFFVIIAIVFPLLLPRLLEFTHLPLDPRIGQLSILSEDQLREVYSGKQVLIVGGTRGVGLGVALAVAAAGADVMVVGRSDKSGQAALERLQSVASRNTTVSFLSGDIGSVTKANALVDRLEEHVKNHDRFDFLVVTAAIFPDWKHSHQQEDGIDRCFAVVVVGRYILYKNMERFVKKDVRVLNVLASGQKMPHYLNRELASGRRNPYHLLESMMVFGVGNELMLLLLDSESEFFKTTTRVSTHPGLLKTELHRGQGFLFGVIEHVMGSLIGITIEDCGSRQASILASPRLSKGQQNYVSFDMKGRQASFEDLAERELPWLKDFLQQLIN